MLRYLELKTGHGDDGPAWIGYVKQSRSGRTVYFDGRAFRRAGGGATGGNYIDVESGDEWWISGVKRDGTDRHRAGGGVVAIEVAAVAEYMALIGAEKLGRGYVVSDDIVETDISKFHELANEPL